MPGYLDVHQLVAPGATPPARRSGSGAGVVRRRGRLLGPLGLRQQKQFEDVAGRHSHSPMARLCDILRQLLYRSEPLSQGLRALSKQVLLNHFH